MILELEKRGVLKYKDNFKIDSKKFIDFDNVLKEKLKNKEFKAEYDLLRPKFEAIEMSLKKRSEYNLSQKDLAKKMGTKQSAISRFESGRYNPSLEFLERLAKALNSTLEIRFKPKN